MSHRFSFLDALSSGIAGGTAGMAVDLVIFPIDTIKTRIQASSGKENYRKQAGKVSKYKGMLTMFCCSFPTASGFFMTYDFTKCTSQLPAPIQHMIAATAGYMVSTLIRNPFEVIKQNLQIGTFENSFEAISNIWKAMGIAGFYRGWTTYILREIPFACIQFPLYEMLKVSLATWLAEKEEKDLQLVTLKAYHYAMAGSIAGTIAGGLTIPMDVLKTRLMTHKLSNKPMKAWPCFKGLLRNEGKKVFFKGMLMRMLYLGVGGIVFFSFYEEVRNFIIRKRVEHTAENDEEEY